MSKYVTSNFLLDKVLYHNIFCELIHRILSKSRYILNSGSFKNYVSQILPNFDHLPPSSGQLSMDILHTTVVFQFKQVQFFLLKSKTTLCSHKGPSINPIVSVGEGEVKNCRFYLVKRPQRGGRGSEIADFETT